MNNIWFTADHHFGHANIIRFCNRPFRDVLEMDRVLTRRWNEKVSENDTVYYLGDFTLGNGEFADNYLPFLNGKKIFINGSHDHRWIDLDSPNLLNLEIPHPDYQFPLVIVMCHYAMRVWDRSHYGSLHLYGHSHGKLPGLGRSMDVGVDTNNFYPYSLEEIKERLLKIEPHDAPKKSEAL